MKRFGLPLALPSFLLLALLVAPLFLGQKTLFLRDVFSAHLSLKAAQVQQMKAEGRVPMVAPALAGGQPLAGNPNAVPLYPDNLLFFFTPFLWAFNAHFWLHLLLAPWAMAWLARRWGLGWPAAWGAGFFFAASGFFLSQMNLYNLVAGSALAPALVAATLALAERPSRRRTAAMAVVWALLLLAGEPLLAAMSLGLAALALVIKEGRRLRDPAVPKRQPVLALALALVLGTVMAAPQLVEFLRTLPLSYRGHQGYSLAGSTAGSFHGSQALEWLLPSAFGRPDQLRGGAFWGYPFFDGLPPLFFSLAPGLVVLALVAVSGLRRQPARLWAWLCVGGGIFLALGRTNPVVEALLKLPGGSLLRYPVKVWLVPALGLALLAGLGLERLLGSEDADAKETRTLRRRLVILLAALAGAYLLLWAWLSWSPAAALALRSLIPSTFGAEFLGLEVERWRMLARVSAALAGLAAVTVTALRHYPGRAAGLLITLHTGSQLFFLHPLLPMDDVQAYTAKPALLRDLPAQGTIVHGSSDFLFGSINVKGGEYPEYTAQWVQRRLFAEGYPPAGILFGRRYELNLSPEGLGSFLTRAARDAISQVDDEQRLRLLAAWGVEHLVIYRPLDPSCAALASLAGRGRSFGNDLFVYRLKQPAPQVSLAAKRIFAPHLNAALGMLSSPAFDPSSMVVLPGEGPAFEGTGGEVAILQEDGESLIVEVRAPGPTTLIWQRPHLPHYRATVDGEAAPVLAANLHRMAVAVPAGSHRIAIEADRRPFRWACLGSLLGLLILLGLTWMGRESASSFWARRSAVRSSRL